jgi:hypothetical protein
MAIRAGFCNFATDYQTHEFQSNANARQAFKAKERGHHNGNGQGFVTRRGQTIY